MHTRKAYKDNTAVYDTVRGLACATRRLGRRKGDAALDVSCPNIDKARHRVQFWSLVVPYSCPIRRLRIIHRHYTSIIHRIGL